MADSRLTQLGPYQILDQIAQGAYGEVLRARHVGPAGFQRILAIKRLRPHVLADASAVRAFENEARIGGLLLHHNIAQTLEFRQDEGLYYLVMEYVDGVSFQDVILNHRQLGRPIPVEIVVELIGQACDGLHHAHEAQGTDGQPLKLVHRDIKPSNLMLTRTGVVKVMDFGIARVDNQNLTDAGFIKGTPRYLSPEMITRNTVLDRRSDLFSLAAVFYELLALKPLFDAPNLLNLMARVRDADVGNQLRELASHRSSFARVLGRCLHPIPSARFQTAREFAREVRLLKRELSLEDPDLESFAQEQLQHLAGRSLRKTVQAGGASALAALGSQTGEAKAGAVFEGQVGGVTLLDGDSRPGAGASASSAPVNTASLLAHVDVLVGLAESRELPGASMGASHSQAPVLAGQVQSLLGPDPLTPEMLGVVPGVGRSPAVLGQRAAAGVPPVSSPGLERPGMMRASSDGAPAGVRDRRAAPMMSGLGPPVVQTVQMTRNPPAPAAQVRSAGPGAEAPNRPSSGSSAVKGFSGLPVNSAGGSSDGAPAAMLRPPSGSTALTPPRISPSDDDDDDDSIQTITGAEPPARSVPAVPMQAPLPLSKANGTAVGEAVVSPSPEPEVELQVEEDLVGPPGPMHQAFSADDWGDDEKSRVMTLEELERLKAGTPDTDMSEAMLRTLSDVPLPSGGFSVRGSEPAPALEKLAQAPAPAGGRNPLVPRASWRAGMTAPPVESQDTTQPSITERMSPTFASNDAPRKVPPLPLGEAIPAATPPSTAPVRAPATTLQHAQPATEVLEREGALKRAPSPFSPQMPQLPPPVLIPAEEDELQVRTRLVSALPGSSGQQRGDGMPELPPPVTAADSPPILETRLFVAPGDPAPRDAPMGVRSTTLVTGPKEAEATESVPVRARPKPVSKLLQPGSILVHVSDKGGAGGLHPLVILGLGLLVVAFILYLLSQL